MLLFVFSFNIMQLPLPLYKLFTFLRYHPSLVEEIEESDDEHSDLKSSNENDFNYQNIIADLKKNGLENVELDEESVQKIYQEEDQIIKLPLSSSSSSLSITSSTESRSKIEDDNQDIPDQEHQATSSDSPIFISSCSTASSLSSSAESESTVSPCSINQLEFAADADLLKNLANDSGVCTNSTSSVLTDEKLIKCVSDQNNNRNELAFNQVSYEFLSDLSQQQTSVNSTNNSSSRFRNKFTIQSRSFSTKISFPKKAQPKNETEVEPIEEYQNMSNSFYNPFNRSAISKSFSAFTSRLKQQQLLVQKSQNHVESEVSLFEFLGLYIHV
jgi:hypothetical protein